MKKGEDKHSCTVNIKLPYLHEGIFRTLPNISDEARVKIVNGWKPFISSVGNPDFSSKKSVSKKMLRKNKYWHYHWLNYIETYSELCQISQMKLAWK